ncbi:MAG: hypothetical protein B7733_00830 [Myxococcales bacterium FL481]|nr:MAG: hypothetical protein B7733_00830 [Myxococcales bacterium FL481]
MECSSWKIRVKFSPSEVRILVTSAAGDLLKARLPSHVGHPRALVTLLEGLALWAGRPQVAAAYVEEGGQGCYERVFYGDRPVEPDAVLVSFEVHDGVSRTRRLRGLGDFRQLRLLGGA